MKIFAHFYGKPYAIANTVESRDIYSVNGVRLDHPRRVWDVYYEDHFGCVAQGFRDVDSALRWIENENKRHVFVWLNDETRDVVQNKYLADADTDVHAEIPWL
ncbi:hypothetical protein SEA_JUMBO_92 [Gordonia phage Jumbo]|uniref:Uncharacterized protein n=1 Tax=Gordonia phage Jumbo TaxID=1887650 RepID=A0A1B3B0P3_9CAUD|nr:hypothetical protein BIZ69_gp092 [Gordonia phage Jumbo]AOE44600.1 hypothetical protein SEA_JUMBO_92 [Gordonia phage Jumbo]